MHKIESIYKQPDENVNNNNNGQSVNILGIYENQSTPIMVPSKQQTFLKVKSFIAKFQPFNNKFPYD